MLSPITFIPAMDAITSQGFPDGSVVVTDIPRIWAIWSDGFCEWPAMAAMKSTRREPEKKTANSLTGFMKSPPATRLQRMIYTATALLRSDDLTGNYLVSKWIGSDPERVADYNVTKPDHFMRQMTKCDRRS
jgi:hypothetical protein